jgi:formate/nitrite transporter FocA (FNT family)
MLGVVALAVTTAALGEVMPESLAHVLASLTFGIGFAFIVIGRSELFTENFLIPVTAAVAGRERPGLLARLWALTFVANVVAIFAIAAVLTVNQVLEPPVLETAGVLADTLGERDFLPSFLSAVIAGVVMTIFTWLVIAADRDTTKVILALLVGFLLAAPSLNHAVVGFGELTFGLLAGTAAIGWDDMVKTLATAILGNLVGGLGLVFVTRLVQVSGHDDGAEKS